MPTDAFAFAYDCNGEESRRLFDPSGRAAYAALLLCSLIAAGIWPRIQEYNG